MPVNSTNAQYGNMTTKWQKCRDVYDGQDAVQAGGERYLPKLADQAGPDYDAYRKRATFYNATYRTISGLKGMVFRVAPVVVVPDVVEPMLDDITLSGIPMDSLAETVMIEVLSVGRIGIFADYPQAPAGITKEDAKTLQLRPNLSLYKPEAILDWSTGRVGNRTVLTQVRLEEVKEVRSADEFSCTTKKQYRVLDLIGGVYRVRVFERQNDKDVQVEPDVFPMMQGKTMDFIPFLFVGLDDTTPDVPIPPLMDLVEVNLSHYRSTADYEHGAHFTGLPTPWISGYKSDDPNEKIHVGSTTIITFPSKDAQCGYMEFTGNGLTTLKDILDRKEAQMAILGARMLEPQHKGVEAADTLDVRRKGEESMLATAAKTVSRALTKALEWIAAWEGAVKLGEDNSEEVSYTLNDQFLPAGLTAQQLTSLISAWQMAAISDQTLFENLKAAGIIGQNTSLEDELARIGERGPLDPNADPNAPPAPGAKSKKPTKEGVPA